MKDSFKLLLLTFAGTAFAGYLAGDKFFNDNCTIGASCAYMFGLPTCYYGFGLFAILLLLSIGYIVTNNTIHTKIMSVVSLVAILFSGYYSYVELLPYLTQGTFSLSIIPSCTYGLVGFILVFYLAYKNIER